jgi:ABC-type transport system involved in multi-copper enzyme maturation permease subunit
VVDLLRSELFRLRHRWMPFVLVAILAAVIVVFYVLLWTVLQTEEAGSEAADLRASLRLAAIRDAGLSLAYQFGSVLLVILASSLIATEYGWGTIRTLLPRASSRTGFFAAKLLTIGVFAIVLMIGGFLASLGASALITTLEDLPRGFGPNVVSETALAIGRNIFAMLPYAALAFMVSLWGKSSAAGISVGLVVLLLEGLVSALFDALGDPFDRLPGALLGENASAIMALNNTGTTDSFAPPSGLPDPWQAAAILTAYIVLFLGLAFWRFRTRDVTSG